ncbi:FbpB family small basic protein [Siminovitchia fortis]|uniref:FbpB family small basic protein n=1 Tax=Siminovitchia fortis TaxID=254758 RepID=A0A443IPZ8_9BACI|nr:FbpB family small basic protein [Siminovitchia fortis]RWR08601.1 FbpB family small basic protein [Siminovitchia fortis]WHY83159.1 FbpB family small basic protein [Siminovitchia fortis]
MRRSKRKTFLNLVEENREALLKDLDALEKIENRLEEKHLKRGKIS